MALGTVPASYDEAIRRVSWGGIFAGVAIALALTVFFTLVGIGMGAAAIDPMGNSADGGGFGWLTALYLFFSQVVALFAGGYTASRLAGVPRTTTSILHGASVWAVATIFVASVSVAGAGALFGTAFSALTSAASGAANVVQAVVPEDVSFPDVKTIVSRISAEDLPQPLRQKLNEKDMSIERLQQEVGAAFSDVISAQERERATEIMTKALSQAVKNPESMSDTLGRALDSLLGGPQAVLSEQDKREALQSLENRLGIDRAEAEEIMNAVQKRIDNTVEQIKQRYAELQQQSLQAIETASSAVSQTAWVLALALLVALAGATGGALMGKPEGVLGDRPH